MISVLKNKNVLFVEDNDEFAQNFMTLLLLFVKEIFHCNTVMAARKTLFDKTVDMIICDIKLGDENGLDFIDMVRKNNAHIPIVILSGNKNEEFLFRAISLKLVAYLLKPIKYKEFIDILTKCAQFFTPQQNVTLKNGYCFDSASKLLYTPRGIAIELRRKEAIFVELLIAHQNRIVTKDMMCASMWNFNDVSNQAVVNFVMRFRKKIGKDFVQTIVDVGYRLGL